MMLIVMMKLNTKISDEFKDSHQNNFSLLVFELGQTVSQQ
jgi:hypothetical protein